MEERFVICYTDNDGHLRARTTYYSTEQKDKESLNKEGVEVLGVFSVEQIRAFVSSLI